MTKKIQGILSLALIVALGMGIVGCAGKFQTEGSKASKKGKAATGMSNAPEWVINGTIYSKDGVPDPYSAVGQAKIVNGNMDFARTKAQARGRAKLARNIEAAIKTSFDQVTNATNSNDESTQSTAMREKIHEIANLSLRGSYPAQGYISDDGTQYAVAIQMTKEGIEKTEKAIKQKLGNKIGAAMIAKLPKEPATLPPKQDN